MIHCFDHNEGDENNIIRVAKCGTNDLDEREKVRAVDDFAYYLEDDKINVNLCSICVEKFEFSLTENVQEESDIKLFRKRMERYEIRNLISKGKRDQVPSFHIINEEKTTSQEFYAKCGYKSPKTQCDSFNFIEPKNYQENDFKCGRCADLV